MEKSCLHCGRTIDKGKYCQECSLKYWAATRIVLAVLTKRFGKLSMENRYDFESCKDELMKNFNFAFADFLKAVKVSEKDFNKMITKIKNGGLNARQKNVTRTKNPTH